MEAGLATILLALVSVYLNHVLANTREKRKVRRERGQALIVAFDRELQALLNTDKDCRHILTHDAWKRHVAAVRSFAPYLSWLERLILEYYWISLTSLKIRKKRYETGYDQYADCGSQYNRTSVRPAVIKRIQRIISLAVK